MPFIKEIPILNPKSVPENGDAFFHSTINFFLKFCVLKTVSLKEKMHFKSVFASLLLVTILFGCSSSNINNSEIENNSESPPVDNQNLKLISLGDSYTVGESVCSVCKFPEQLKDSILKNTEKKMVDLKVIATTGWTTTNLKNAINVANLKNEYDLVTLLIGVNNQYQNKPFTIFKTEFRELVNTSKTLAKGDKDKVIVISIPDYAFTPFGNGNESISQDIDMYNNFIEGVCKQYGITYIYITDITREGLENPELVASDGLHPSTLAYSKFVSRLLPKALEKMGLAVN